MQSEITAAAVAGVVTGFLGWIGGRRKTNAEAEATLSGATLDYAQELRAEMVTLRNHVTQIENERDAYRDELEQIRIEVAELRVMLAQLTRQTPPSAPPLPASAPGKPSEETEQQASDEKGA